MKRSKWLKSNVWFKIMAVIIINALLLTQVDFSLAAIYNNKESYQEAALRYQKITDKSVSLISGIGCVQLALSSLHLPQFSLSALFAILKGSGSSMSELSKTGKICLDSKGFCKVFCVNNIDFQIQGVFIGVLKNADDKRALIARARTQESTGPPMINKIVVVNFVNRTVRI